MTKDDTMSPLKCPIVVDCISNIVWESSKLCHCVVYKRFSRTSFYGKSTPNSLRMSLLTIR